mgnify:CR=1 FL=1
MRGRVLVFVEIDEDNYCTPVQIEVSSMEIASKLLGQVAVDTPSQVDAWASIMVVRGRR